MYENVTFCAFYTNLPPIGCSSGSLMKPFQRYLCCANRNRTGNDICGGFYEATIQPRDLNFITHLQNNTKFTQVGHRALLKMALIELKLKKFKRLDQIEPKFPTVYWNSGIYVM